MQINPKSVDSYRKLALIYIDIGDEYRAIEQINSLRNLNRDDLADELEKSLYEPQ